MTMDTAADLSGSVGYVPLVYLARFFGIQVAWDGVSRTVSLTGSAGLTVADTSSIQAYTDMTFYGQGLVSVISNETILHPGGSGDPVPGLWADRDRGCVRSGTDCDPEHCGKHWSHFQ